MLLAAAKVYAVLIFVDGSGIGSLNVARSQKVRGRQRKEMMAFGLLQIYANGLCAATDDTCHNGGFQLWLSASTA
jgi:hypothetical protein